MKFSDLILPSPLPSVAKMLFKFRFQYSGVVQHYRILSNCALYVVGFLVIEILGESYWFSQIRLLDYNGEILSTTCQYERCIVRKYFEILADGVQSNVNKVITEKFNHHQYDLKFYYRIRFKNLFIIINFLILWENYLIFFEN